MAIQSQITTLIAVMGIWSTLNVGILIMYGRWIWELNKKSSKGVAGSDCEQRNENHYKDAKAMRLEVKADFEKMAIEVSKRFSEGMARLSREREVSINSLKDQLDIYNSMVLANNKANTEQHQANFALLVDALKEIGCHPVNGKGS